ncbi:glycosyl hydrolase family 61-domain-containing protein [Coniochaeta sp. 2T2.1]|nr:glycosyl hydrolase family 61-domain-containing protein [Coniochaeta sp. 2T2.1]
MRPSTILSLLGALRLATAHTVFTTLFISDVNQGDGTCVRMPHDGSTSTAPIRPITSTDMVCGRDGLSPVAFTCPAPAGSKLTFEFREWADASQAGAIDISHKGPCAVYLKQLDNITTSPAEGDGWFKIWEDGYDESSGKWCTEKLIDNAGLLSVALPGALPTGIFLVRPELLALQQADKGDPQFYAGCAQLFVQGTGAGKLDIPADKKVSIPGHVNAADKGLTFNIYDQKLALPYLIPGPAVFFPVSDGAPPTTPGLKAAAGAPVVQKQTQGTIPSGCLLKNANWCGFEVADYNTEDGCWAASADCFEQSKTCFDTAPPTGSANCRVWERKCLDIQTACGNKQFAGPPNKGVKLVGVEAKVPGPIPGVEGGPGEGTTVAGGSATTSAAQALATSKEPTSAPEVTGTVAPPAAAQPTGATTPGPDDTDGMCPAQLISQDGFCGGDLGQTCSGSPFGGCCSKYGKCGSTRFHCGCGCQGDFGECSRRK